jgi:hypothetical protein
MLFRFSDQFSLIKLVKNQFEIKIYFSSIFFENPIIGFLTFRKKYFFLPQEKLLKVPSTYKFLLLCGEFKIFEGCDKNGLCGEFQK